MEQFSFAEELPGAWPVLSSVGASFVSQESPIR